jgi:hypothetical protein
MGAPGRDGGRVGVRDRPREQESLRGRASEPDERVGLLLGLDPLGDHRQPEAVREIDHDPHDGAGRRRPS